jgi:hypothetical protein
MWIAKTSAADGIAAVVFGTVLFLILFGFVTLVKWIFRLITGKPDPAKMESAILVLEYESRENATEDDEREDYEDCEDIKKFALYLHSKLAEKQAGHLAGIDHEDNELFLCFVGADANRICESLNAEVTNYSPSKPQRVILKRAKKNGGTRIMDHLPWQPDHKLEFQPPPEMVLTEVWIRLSGISRVLTKSGLLGLLGWGIFRVSRGQAENEFMATGLGMFLAYLIGTVLVSGLSLALACNIRIRTMTKAAGFPHDDAPISNTLKHVLLVVLAIFGLIFLLILKAKN